MRFSLQTKSVTAAPPGSPADNPATMLRSGNVPMDEGRAWSGDLYTEGEVTDPGSAFASFSDDATDTEAWLDMAPDGTIVGWVRQGDEIYRYLDPDSWSMDVDGAGIPRTDGGATPEGITPDEGVTDELADPNADPAAEFDPVLDAAADPEGVVAAEEEATTADPERTIGDMAPTAFEEEGDEAVEDGDPTEVLEDPTALPEGEDDGGDEADEAFADLIGDGVAPEETEAQAAVEADADDTITVAAEDMPVTPEVPEDPDAPPHTPDEELEEELEPEDEEEEEEETEEEKRLKGKTSGVKHAQGDHNQDTHGRRYGIGSRSPRGRAGAATAVTGPKPKATLGDTTIARMTDSELEGITESADSFTSETLWAAAAELDKRNPIGEQVWDDLDGTRPGSMEEHNALQDLIPREWVEWAGRGGDEASKPKPRTKKEIAEDEWLDFMERQKLAAGAEAVGAGLIPPGLNAAFMKQYGSVDALFDGRIPHSARNRWLTTEAKQWFDMNFVSKTEFMEGRSTSSKRPGKRLRSSLNEN